MRLATFTKGDYQLLQNIKNLVKPPLSRVKQSVLFSWGKQWKFRSALISQETKLKAKSFFDQRQSKLFFILGTGRSGTQLFSSLFSHADHCLAFHEPNFMEDVGTMEEFRQKPKKCARYWERFRQYEIYKRWSAAPEALFYGEINGTIRYHAKAIIKTLPKAKLFLVTRDGRGVVRSVMGWPQFYGPESRGAYALPPLPNDPFQDKWDRMTRFEKICWSWQEANEFIMDSVPEDQRIQLERISTDFEYFSEKLARPIGLSISHDVWREVVSKKSDNASKYYDFPAWDDWTPEQQEIFKQICGKTMSRLGHHI